MCGDVAGVPAGGPAEAAPAGTNVRAPAPSSDSETAHPPLVRIVGSPFGLGAASAAPRLTCSAGHSPDKNYTRIILPIAEQQGARPHFRQARPPDRAPAAGPWAENGLDGRALARLQARLEHLPPATATRSQPCGLHGLREAMELGVPGMRRGSTSPAYGGSGGGGGEAVRRVPAEAVGCACPGQPGGARREPWTAVASRGLLTRQFGPRAGDGNRTRVLSLGS
jgi:hypothetical protein